MPELHLDCPAGIAGDMFLAAMADLGVELAHLRAAFARAGVNVEITALDARDKGISGKRMHIAAPHAQPLRHLAELKDIVRALPFSENVRLRSEDALARLAEVEARVHGCKVADVHFHEVGAVDTLVDVVGAFWALETLGVSRVTCSRLPWFSGTVQCAHGLMPLPAPATTILLQGKPVYPTEFTGELITPTGALLLDRMVDEFTSGPAGCLERSGLGLGTMDLPTVNGLRALLLSGDGPGLERVMVLETNVDHLTGEEIGGVFGVLLDAGALDVLFLPGVMKKNRPGGLLQVLCRPGDLARIRDLTFAQTMTLGLRMTETTRAVLPRAASTRTTPWGDVSAKETVIEGESYSRPEFEALQALAKRTGRSVAQLRYLLDKD
ncbi:MAG: TIGR00299 family protein [Deltaproteobacteria bacterium HGW-Deltaproteobacteria-18]|nr:MAG: TIGR00299 family protein [Deltaproteobacteria bacterium HGW-Deltaproteobacteria-18]